MRSHILIAAPASALLLTGCFDPFGLFGPAKLKVDEITITTVIPGADDSVRREIFDYDDKGRLVELQERIDDTRRTFEFGYSGDVVDEIEFTGPGGDRVRTNFDVVGGKITGGERVGDDFDADIEIDYFNDDVKLLKEIVIRQDLEKQFDAAVLVESESTFSYDGNKLAQITTDTVTIVEGEPAGDTRGILEYKYDADGRVNRLDTEFDDGVEDTELVFQTYDVDYTEDGRVDEVEDFDADDEDRFRVDYDEDGRVTEVEHIIGDVRIISEYTYAEGDIRGGYLSPGIPAPADLKGKSRPTEGATGVLFGRSFVGR